eukprot:scaffold80902_cov69-Phaeocystis_antarctica.AAC.5
MDSRQHSIDIHALTCASTGTISQGQSSCRTKSCGRSARLPSGNSRRQPPGGRRRLLRRGGRVAKNDERLRVSLGGTQPFVISPLAIRSSAGGAIASSCCSFGSDGAVLRSAGGSAGSVAPALASAASTLAHSPKIALRSSPPSIESMDELFPRFGLAHGAGFASLGQVTCGIAPCCSAMKGRGAGRTTRVCVMT